jgi:hypothetical protein
MNSSRADARDIPCHSPSSAGLRVRCAGEANAEILTTRQARAGRPIEKREARQAPGFRSCDDSAAGLWGPRHRGFFYVRRSLRVISSAPPCFA